MVDNDTNRDVHGHSSLKSAPGEKSSMGWLPWLIGALLLAGLLYFLLRDDDNDVARTTEPDTVVTETAAPTANSTIGTTAGEPTAYTREAFDRTLTGTEPLPATYALDRVTFDTGSATLGTAAAAQVADVAESLKSRSTARVSLRGYADPSGDAAANQKLSEDRVAAVRAALVKGGVAENQITADASGETGSAATRSNRRVDITLLQR